MLSLAARTVGDQAHGCPPSRREHFRGWRDRISFHRTSDLSDVCCNDTVAMMRRMIESPPRRWPRSRTNLARKRSFHPLAYSQEKARWNVYQVRYTCTWIEASWHGLRPRSTRIHHPNRREILRVPSLHFRHFHNFVYRLELRRFPGCFSSSLRKETRDDRDRRLSAYNPRSSFFSAHDASGFENNNHVQTRTAHAPEVYRHTNMAQCFRHVYRRVHQHAKAHVLHFYYHACTAPTCLWTLVFRVRVSLLRSVIRNVQKLRLIDWKDHVSLARCILLSQENTWKAAICDNLYAPGIKTDCCTLYINCYVHRVNLLASF